MLERYKEMKRIIQQQGMCGLNYSGNECTTGKLEASCWGQIFLEKIYWSPTVNTNVKVHNQSLILTVGFFVCGDHKGHFRMQSIHK